MRKMMTFAYGAFAYTCFLMTILYAVGFVGDFGVPKSINSGAVGPVGESILINVALLTLFALQHSIMARPGFKAVWTKIVPKPIERSTFVLATCAVMALMFVEWRAMPQVIWQTEGIAAMVLFGISMLGWATVVASTFMVHHFDLFGLRQVWLYAQGEKYKEVGFRTPYLYKIVRHPIMVGFMIAFWATPMMTGGRLLFAAVTTAYIVVAIQFEEHDLIGYYGERYENYRRQVGALIPRLRPAGKVKEVSQVS